MWVLILWILLFIGSFLLIYYFADVFLDNLKEVCIIYGLSAFIMGSLIIGIDPEESVASIMAGVNKLPYIAVGNVIGNSIIALTLCFAIPALFYNFKFKKISIFHFFIIYIGIFVIILGFFINYGLLIAGICAIAIYLIYFFRNLRYARKTETPEEGFDFKEEEEEEGKEKFKRKMIILVAISLVIIFLGGELMMMAANGVIEEIVILTGISETKLESVFGFIIIAFVTNVEELTLMIKSIQKHSVEIGIGGMIGKLIWNLTLIFGISSVLLISIPFTWTLIWNVIILFVVVSTFYLITKKRSMNKRDGIIFAIFFIIFLIVNFI